MYKSGRTHVIADALSRLLNSIEPTSVPNQTTYASFFYIGHVWLNDAKDFLKIG